MNTYDPAAAAYAAQATRKDLQNWRDRSYLTSDLRTSRGRSAEYFLFSIYEAAIFASASRKGLSLDVIRQAFLGRIVDIKRGWKRGQRRNGDTLEVLSKALEAGELGEFCQRDLARPHYWVVAIGDATIQTEVPSPTGEKSRSIMAYACEQSGISEVIADIDSHPVDFDQFGSYLVINITEIITSVHVRLDEFANA